MRQSILLVEAYDFQVHGLSRPNYMSMTLHPEPLSREQSILDRNAGSENRSAVWTRHWSTGAAHSCHGTYGDLYGGAIATFWRDVLSPLQRGQRVLDIATGNGALPRLLLGLHPELEIDVDAIDIAAVEPHWVRDLSPGRQHCVRFHPGQAAEMLPFPDHQFDLVISQYGLEYSDLDRSVPEMLRVLAPTGGIALLLHHADSRPVQLAAVELEHIQWLQSPRGLLRAAEALFEPLSRAATPEGRASLASDPAAEAAREHFNAAQDALGVRAKRLGGDGADVLFETQDAVAQMLSLVIREGTEVACDRLQAVLAALSDSRVRLEELRRHALPADGLDELLGRLRGAGRLVTAETTHDGPHLMGWRVRSKATGIVART